MCHFKCDFEPFFVVYIEGDMESFEASNKCNIKVALES